MKDRLLPVFDRSVSALLTDLEQRGMLDETLVVFLTDFGCTPKINKNCGRHPHPGVYPVALAGGGIRGGQVYGSSDSRGLNRVLTPAHQLISMPPSILQWVLTIVPSYTINWGGPCRSVTVSPCLCSERIAGD